MTVACSDELPITPPSGRDPAALTKVSGDNQSGTVAAELGALLGVGVVDTSGAPVQGHTVQFRVKSGGGTVSPSAKVSDENGLVEVRWTLGTSVADSQVVEAFGSSALSPVEFTATPEPGPTVTVGIALAALADTFLFAGDTIVLGDSVGLTALIRDQFGNTSGSAPTWSSSDVSVASVTPGGLVHAVDLGSASILATHGGVSGTFNLAVAQFPDSIDVTPSAIEMDALLDTVRLAAAVYDRNGNPIPGLAPTWTSTIDSVVAVDTVGVTTALSEGLAYVVAGTEGRTAPIRDSALVSVMQSPASVTVMPENPQLTALGDTVSLSVEVRDANGFELAPPFQLEWRSEDTNVVDVSPTGTLTARGNGVTSVVASVDSLSDTAAVSVEQEPVTLALVAGGDQVDTVTATLPAEIVVQARDRRGAPVPGSSISIRPDAGSIPDSSVQTDPQGEVRIAWTLGEPAGQQAVVFFLFVPDTSGTVADSLTVTADADAGNPSVLQVQPSDTTVLVGSMFPLGTSTTDAYGNALDTVPDWTSDDLSVATVDSLGVVSARAPGQSLIVASFADAADSTTVTVAAPPNMIAQPAVTVGAGLQRASTAVLGAADHGGVDVVLTSLDPATAVVSPNAGTPGSTSIVIPVADGVADVEHVVQGVEGAADTGEATVLIEAQAPGFLPDTVAHTVRRAAAQLSGLDTNPTEVAPDDPFIVEVGIPDEALTAMQELQVIRAGGTAVTATITSSDPLVAQLVTTGTIGGAVSVEIDPLANTSPATVPAGGVALDPLADGISTVAVSISGFTALPTASATVVVEPVDPPPDPVFPIAISGRVIVDASANPMVLNGDTPWSLAVQLDSTEVQTYLDTRQAQGVNAIIFNSIEHEFADAAPLNTFGDAPFTQVLPGGVEDFTTSNDPYWDYVEWIVAQAAERGMICLITPAYIGFSFGSQGWSAEMEANGTARLATYGNALGTRFASYGNVIWVMGGDWGPVFGGTNLTAEVNAIAQGIEATMPGAIFTAHAQRYQSALDAYDQPWLDVNTTYSDTASGPTDLETDYQRTDGVGEAAMPSIWIEGYYENEHSVTDEKVRSQMYWSLLGGAVGHFYGAAPMWSFDAASAAFFSDISVPPYDTWTNTIVTDVANDLLHVRELIDRYPVHLLVPDYSESVVIAGRGSGVNYAAAASLPDGSLMLAYLPTARTVTVDMSSLTAGANATASWWDPRTGASTAIGTFSTSGTRDFTSPSSTDWMLVIEIGGG